MWIGYKGLQPCSSASTAHLLFIKPLRYLSKTSLAPGAICTDFVSCGNEEPKLDAVGEGPFPLPTSPWLSCLSVQSHLEHKITVPMEKNVCIQERNKAYEKEKAMEVLGEGLGALHAKSAQEGQGFWLLWVLLEKKNGLGARVK